MNSRETLQSTLSQKFVWAIAYGSYIGWGAFILPGDWITQSRTNRCFYWNNYWCVNDDFNWY